MKYKKGQQLNLSQQVINKELWPTPTSSDGKNSTLPISQINRNSIPGKLLRNASWATPTTMDRLKPKSIKALRKEATTARPGKSRPGNLRDQVSNTKNWPTPRCSDGMIHQLRDMNGKQSRSRLENVISSENNAAGQFLNPEWVEWLMGWPINWTSIAPMSTKHYQYWISAGLSWWDSDISEIPYEINGKLIPRTLINKKEMKNLSRRIIASGNGQVPAVMAEAWTLLLNEKQR